MFINSLFIPKISLAKPQNDAAAPALENFSYLFSDIIKITSIENPLLNDKVAEITTLEKPAKNQINFLDAAIFKQNDIVSTENPISKLIYFFVSRPDELENKIANLNSAASAKIKFLSMTQNEFINGVKQLLSEIKNTGKDSETDLSIQFLSGNVLNQKIIDGSNLNDLQVFLDTELNQNENFSLILKKANKEILIDVEPYIRTENNLKLVTNDNVLPDTQQPVLQQDVKSLFTNVTYDTTVSYVNTDINFNISSPELYVNTNVKLNEPKPSSQVKLKTLIDPKSSQSVNDNSNTYLNANSTDITQIVEQFDSSLNELETTIKNFTQPLSVKQLPVDKAPEQAVKQSEQYIDPKLSFNEVIAFDNQKLSSQLIGELETIEKDILTKVPKDIKAAFTKETVPETKSSVNQKAVYTPDVKPLIGSDIKNDFKVSENFNNPVVTKTETSSNIKDRFNLLDPNVVKESGLKEITLQNKGTIPQPVSLTSAQKSDTIIISNDGKLKSGTNIDKELNQPNKINSLELKTEKINVSNKETAEQPSLPATLQKNDTIIISNKSKLKSVFSVNAELSQIKKLNSDDLKTEKRTQSEQSTKNYSAKDYNAFIESENEIVKDSPVQKENFFAKFNLKPVVENKTDKIPANVKSDFKFIEFVEENNSNPEPIKLSDTQNIGIKEKPKTEVKIHDITIKQKQETSSVKTKEDQTEQLQIKSVNYQSIDPDDSKEQLETLDNNMKTKTLNVNSKDDLKSLQVSESKADKSRLLNTVFSIIEADDENQYNSEVTAKEKTDNTKLKTASNSVEEGPQTVNAKRPITLLVNESVKNLNDNEDKFTTPVQESINANVLKPKKLHQDSSSNPNRELFVKVIFSEKELDQNKALADQPALQKEIFSEPLDQNFKDFSNKQDSSDLKNFNSAEQIKNEKKTVSASEFKVNDEEDRKVFETDSIRLTQNAKTEPQQIFQHHKTAFADYVRNSIKADFTNTVTKTVNSGEVLQEIQKVFETAANSSVVLKLLPEQMGSVKVTIETINQSVDAKIEVENEQVKNVIVSTVDQLKQSLSQNGVHVNSVSISLIGSEHKQSSTFNQRKKNSPGMNLKNLEQVDEKPVIKNYGYNTYEFLA